VVQIDAGGMGEAHKGALASSAMPTIQS